MMHRLFYSEHAVSVRACRVGKQSTLIGEVYAEEAKNAAKQPKQPKQQEESLYEDAEFLGEATKVSKPIDRKKAKGSLQVNADGSRFAPWMNIDEQRIDKIRAERRENKKKYGTFFGKGMDRREN